MESKEKIVARVKILPEFLSEKHNTMVDLKSYYSDWYSFSEQKDLDVSLYSKSKLNKEGTLFDITYFYRLPDKSVKLIPKKHCKIIYEFL